MEKKRKVLIAVLLAVLPILILIIILPFAIFADFKNQAKSAAHNAAALGYTYIEQADGTAQITRYDETITNEKDVVIPEELAGLKVTTIGEEAFLNCKGLTSITIPNSVTTIGKKAFMGCSGLTSIIIPNSVTRIRDNTFGDCFGLTSIEIPSGVKSIEDYAFRQCTGLTSITIPNSVTSIGNYAFYQCSSLEEAKVFPGSYAEKYGNNERHELPIKLMNNEEQTLVENQAKTEAYKDTALDYKRIIGVILIGIVIGVILIGIVAGLFAFAVLSFMQKRHKPPIKPMNSEDQTLVEDEAKTGACKDAALDYKRIIGVISLVIGGVLAVFFALSIMPKSGKITEFVWNYIKKESPKFPSREFLKDDAAILAAFGVFATILITVGIALIRKNRVCTTNREHPSDSLNRDFDNHAFFHEQEKPCKKARLTTEKNRSSSLP